METTAGNLSTRGREQMRKDITGMKFGRLTAIEPVGKDNRRNILWKCRCDCGNECVRAVAETQIIAHGFL